MKTDTILSILSLAPLAWSSPLPIVLVDLAPAAAHHPPAPVRPGQRLPHFTTTSSKHADIDDDDDEASTQKPIDNRPISPSSSVVPSVALASPQPVVTTYLLSLSAEAKSRTGGKADAAIVMDGAKATKEAMAAVQGSTSAQMEMGIAQGQGHSETAESDASKTAKKISLPCYLAHLRTDYTDMLAVGLVALFLVIIVVVETWDSICQK